MYKTEHQKYKRIKLLLLASFKYKANKAIEMIDQLENQYVKITNTIGSFLMKYDVSYVKKWNLTIVSLTDHKWILIEVEFDQFNSM